MSKTTVTLDYVKETPNTFQFACPKDKRKEFAVPVIYVKKDAFDKIPKKVKVTVESA